MANAMPVFSHVRNWVVSGQSAYRRSTTGTGLSPSGPIPDVQKVVLDFYAGRAGNLNGERVQSPVTGQLFVRTLR